MNDKNSTNEIDPNHFGMFVYTRNWAVEEPEWQEDDVVVIRHKTSTEGADQFIFAAFNCDLPPFIGEDEPTSEVIEKYWGAVGFDNCTSLFENLDFDGGKWTCYATDTLPDYIIASALRRVNIYGKNMVFVYNPKRGLIMSEYPIDSVFPYYEDHGRLPK